jgi:hypothetical protein
MRSLTLSRQRRSHSAERDRDQAAAQQGEAGCGKDEESLGSDITVVTHDTPVASAPGNGANQLIKDVGIPASRERPVLELPSFQPDPFPFAAIDRATPARRQANTVRLQVGNGRGAGRHQDTTQLRDRLETGPRHQKNGTDGHQEKARPVRSEPQECHAASWRLQSLARWPGGVLAAKRSPPDSRAYHVQETAENEQRSKSHQEHFSPLISSLQRTHTIEIQAREG